MRGSFFKNLILIASYRRDSSKNYLAGFSKSRLLITALVVASFVSLGNKDVMACALDSPLGFDAFSVSHKGVISVAMATRAAVESGHLSALPEHEKKRQWILKVIRARAAAHMLALSKHESSGPPISVLLTQTGAWMRFNDPEFGARYHTSPPGQGELTILLPDVAYFELLGGKLDVEDLVDLKVLRIFGESENNSTQAKEAFRLAMQTGIRKKRQAEPFQDN